MSTNNLRAAFFGITFAVASGMIAADTDTGKKAGADAAKPSAPTVAEAPKVAPATCEAALKQASEKGKHLFVLIHETDSKRAGELKAKLVTALEGIGDKAEMALLDKKSETDKEFIEANGLNKAPAPFVLVFAPNGMLVAGFPHAEVTKEKLQKSFASPGKQKCLKTLRERKLVFICAQNAKTKNNDAAMKGVNDFKADQRFAQATEVVSVDPQNAEEKSFLDELKADVGSGDAFTIFLAPPGAIITQKSGATTKDEFVAALTAASSGGCGSGGCGPKGCN